MMAQIIITAIGPDRPGLVDELTGSLLATDGNVADTRMINLRGQFAIIMLVEAPGSAVDAIIAAVKQAGEKAGLSIHVQQPEAAPAPRGRHGIAFVLKTYSMDKPGIVHKITHLLHEHNVNIEELQTNLEPGAYSGTPLFSMELNMSVPAELQVKTLRGELEALCSSLNCDFTLERA